MNRFALAVIGSALLILASHVGAGVVTRFTSNSGNDWATPANWDNGVPGANDRAVIPSGQTCVVGTTTATTAYADTIEVQTGGSGPGTLEINYQSSLTLYNAVDNISPTGPDNSLIDGSIVLDVSGSTGAALVFQGDHVLAGAGRVRGEVSDAVPKVVIGPWKTLRNQLYSSDGSSGIIGSLTITDTGAQTPATPHFENDGGTVAVGYNGQHDHHIIVASSVAIDDTSGALWTVNSCKGELTFDSGSTALAGDFKMSHSGFGIFTINQDIKICGAYEHVGTLDVASGHTFGYTSWIPYGACTNPGTHTGTLSCSNPYIATGHNACAVCGE